MKRHLAVPLFLVMALPSAAGILNARQDGPAAYSSPGQQPQDQPVPQQVWTPEQLDNLVAPIALYPDPLLGQVLAASTYPIEVVEASQWLQQNGSLRGEELVDAAKSQPWDPSVQALVAIPDALSKLNQDIRWTTDLGNAFLAQQSDVMEAVQRMRARAEDRGRLDSTAEQTVVDQEQGGQEAIAIQPADPDVIYVPTYDPEYVWGPPAFGYYPPLYYPAFGFGFGPGFDLGFCFDGWGGWGAWGWYPGWFGNSLYVNNYFFRHYRFHSPIGGGFRGGTLWVHDPAHRMSVPYGNSRVAARFGGAEIASGNSLRPRAGLPVPASPLAGHPADRAYAHPAPGVQRFQNPPRQNLESARPSGPASQQYQPGPRVVPFAGQASPRYVAPPQYSYAPQPYRPAPRVQQLPSRPMFQAPRQFNAAPQMQMPRFGGGGFSRGGGFGGGGGFSHGGGHR